PAACRAGRTGDGGAACGGNGRDELGLQLRFHAGDAGFLQENPAGSHRGPAGRIRPDRHGRHGFTGAAVGSVHWQTQRGAVHLLTKRTSLYQPADRGVFRGGRWWVRFIVKLAAKLYIYLKSEKAYISPPIAVCFVFGILWPRVNG